MPCRTVKTKVENFKKNAAKQEGEQHVGNTKKVVKRIKMTNQKMQNVDSTPHAHKTVSALHTK